MLRPIAKGAGRTVSRQFSQRIFRRGLSLLELIGCLTAIGGGLLLGALYLGVDVKTTSMELLRKFELVEPQRQAAESANPEIPNPMPKVDQRKTVPVHQTVAGKESGILAVAPEAPVAPTGTRTEPSATRQFWHHLLEIMRQESKSRQEHEKGQLFEYLTARQQRHQEAADAISRLGQPRAVDPKVLAYAEQALKWHQSGVELYRHAAQMLTFAPASKLSGPFAQSWRSAATQHRMEEKLLLAKQDAVSSYLESLPGTEAPAR